MRRVESALSLAAAILLAATAGCTSQPAEAEAASPEEVAFVEYARRSLADAEARGASRSQIAALEAVVAVGSVSFETYRTSVEATLACFDEVGIAYTSREAEDGSGVPVIEYSFSGPASGSAVADGCISANSEIVETLYMIQPSTQRLRDASFEKRMDVLIPCLVEAGFVAETEASDISVSEAQEALLTMINSGTSDPYRCATLAGIESF